ncbi:MAG: transposase [Colwellia sp.]
MWFQDEARFGQQNTTTRLWAEKGSRPRAVRQQQFQNAHIYGAVCPATGQTEAIISPILSMEMMKIHLQQIADATPEGRHAVVIMDCASWHADKVAEDIEKITIIHLPPYSPELNPVEQVWQWLRQRKLANSCFSGYENIVDRVSDAWNAFREDANRVKSMCTRSWTDLIT